MVNPRIVNMKGRKLRRIVRCLKGQGLEPVMNYDFHRFLSLFSIKMARFLQMLQAFIATFGKFLTRIQAFF
jgi:hypothetical protein